MKASELRNKSVAELEAELKNQLAEQFKRKMQHVTGQLGQSHLLKASRKEIAKIKTVLSEKAGK